MIHPGHGNVKKITKAKNHISREKLKFKLTMKGKSKIFKGKARFILFLIRSLFTFY